MSTAIDVDYFDDLLDLTDVPDIDTEAQTSDRTLPPRDGYHTAKVFWGRTFSNKVFTKGNVTKDFSGQPFFIGVVEEGKQNAGQEFGMANLVFRIENEKGDEFGIYVSANTFVSKGSTIIDDILAAFGMDPNVRKAASIGSKLKALKEFVDAGTTLTVRTRLFTNYDTGKLDDRGYAIKRVIHRGEAKHLNEDGTLRLYTSVNVNGVDRDAFTDAEIVEYVRP